MQIERYLPFYSDSQILVISSEELKKQRRLTLQRVFSFLEVDDTFFCPEYSDVLHRSSDKKRKNQLRGWLAKSGIGPQVKKFMPAPIVKTFDQVTLTETKKPELDPKIRQTLIEFLQDDVNRLRAYTGKKFADWCL